MSVAATPAQRRAARRNLPGRIRPGVLGFVRGIAYHGRRVTCPCCRHSFREFRPHRGRRRARCPRCGSLERHRALWLWLERSTDLLRAELSVLHVAPEYELQRRLARIPTLDYVSVDLESPLAMVRADVIAMPFADASFDVVLCNHVLEHVADDLMAMREIRRVLRPGGWAVLLVPIEPGRLTTFEDPSITRPADRLRAYGQEDHARVYGRDYPQRLAGAGFEVEVVNAGRGMTPGDVRRYGLRRGEAIEPIYVVHWAA